MGTTRQMRATLAEDKKAKAAKAVARLETLGNEIAERIKIADKALAGLKEKASREFKDFVGHRASIAKMLADAKAECKKVGMKFEDFRLKYAPNFQRSLTYELIAIGEGQLTLADVQGKAAQRKREQRERDADNPKPPPAPPVRASNGDVIDPADLGPAAQAQLAGNWQHEISNDEAKARMAALDGDAPPTQPAPGDTKQIKKGSSAWCRGEFVAACRLYLPKLGLADIRGVEAEFAAIIEPLRERLEAAAADATKKAA